MFLTLELKTPTKLPIQTPEPQTTALSHFQLRAAYRTVQIIKSPKG